MSAPSARALSISYVRDIVFEPLQLQGPSGKTSRIVFEDFECVDIPFVLSSPWPRTESLWPT